MKPHPWTLMVHTSMLKSKASLTCSEIRATYGDPEGRQAAADRLHQAMSRRWFDVSLRDGSYVYTAVERAGARYSVWTPEKDALLAKWWPIEGLKCVRHFKGVSKDGVRSRVEAMNKKLPEEQRIHRQFTGKRRPRKPPQQEQRTTVSRDGLPLVNSVWHYAERVAA